MPLSTTLKVTLQAGLTKALDLVTGAVPLDITKTIQLLTGVGLNQADKIFHDRRTIGGGATDSLDLAGALADAFGDALSFARAKAVLIIADAANPNVINVQRPAANGAPLFVAAGDAMPLRPGGLILWVAPDAVAVAVTAGTGDLLDLVNTASGNVTYDIVIIGASA